MNRILFSFLFLFFCTNTIFGQYRGEEYISGTTAEMLESNNSNRSGRKYSANGRPFTPRGDLHGLIICAGFGDKYDTQTVDNWSSESDSLPRVLTNGSLFYSDFSQFTMNPPATDLRNISAYYYVMSGGQFRLTMDVYPRRINIDTENICNIDWSCTTTEVMEQLKRDDPDFDWSPYDNRKNMPEYEYNNINTDPDMKPDFVIIIYRYRGNFELMPNVPTYNRNVGGWANIDIDKNFNHNGYTFDSSCGFTQLGGGERITQTFIHEMAHILFGAPHVGGSNNIIGNFFYMEHAWSQMVRDLRSFVCSNAWERWYLDWIDEIKASGVSAEINSESDLNSNGEYILRDFITTGDALRIKIPNGSERDQYVWLENHQDKSIFDSPQDLTDGCNNLFPAPPRGIVCFYESINGNKNVTGGTFYAGANGIKVINAQGNYDYSYDPESDPGASPCYWDNAVFNFHRKEYNPIAGQSGTQRIKNDFYKKNKIDIGTGGANSAGVEWWNYDISLVMRDGQIVHEYMDSHQSFAAGRKLSMSSNPCLVNRPTFNKSANKMNPYYLNGISISFLNYNQNGDARVKIRFKDVDIINNTRYTGTIYLPDITEDHNPDIKINSGHTLTIDKSGTPNRTTKTSRGDFINLTEFRCLENAHFMLDGNSCVVVDSLSSFVLESTSSLTIKDGASFIVKNGSTLFIKSGANVIVQGTGRIRIEDGAYLCIENGSSVLLQDTLSAIYLSETASLECEPDATTQSSSCISSIDAIHYDGKGTIADGSRDVYLYNTVFDQNRYIGGRNIYVCKRRLGTWLPSPNIHVTISNNAKVIFEGKEVFFNSGFECQKGASFEVRKK